MNDMRCEFRGDGGGQAPVGGVEVGGVKWKQGDEGSDGVDVSLHDVAAKRAAGGGGKFKVDDAACLERAERGASESLGCEIGGEA